MQKTFKNQQGREFLLLDLPEYSDTPYLATIRGQDVIVFNYDDKRIRTENIPQGNYQILCLAKDATEELASEIVHYTLKDGYLKCYYNYVVKHYTHSLFDAKESLTSLLTSLGFKQDDNVLILEKI